MSAAPPSDNPDLLQLLMDLRRQGITDAALLRAIESLPRPLFLPEESRALAYGVKPAPLPDGQSATAPRFVADMVHELALQPDMIVLEIGTGSGYQAALMAKLVRRVYTLERHKAILGEARTIFRALKIENIVSLQRDGAEGWREQAPFDRIIANVAFPAMPLALAEQLRMEGALLVPVVNGLGRQELLRITRQRRGLLRSLIGESAFPPISEGVSGGGGGAGGARGAAAKKDAP